MRRLITMVAVTLALTITGWAGPVQSAVDQHIVYAYADAGPNHPHLVTAPKITWTIAQQQQVMSRAAEILDSGHIVDPEDLVAVTRADCLTTVHDAAQVCPRLPITVAHIDTGSKDKSDYGIALSYSDSTGRMDIDRIQFDPTLLGADNDTIMTVVHHELTHADQMRVTASTSRWNALGRAAAARWGDLDGHPSSPNDGVEMLTDCQMVTDLLDHASYDQGRTYMNVYLPYIYSSSAFIRSNGDLVTTCRDWRTTVWQPVLGQTR